MLFWERVREEEVNLEQLQEELLAWLESELLLFDMRKVQVLIWSVLIARAKGKAILRNAAQRCSVSIQDLVKHLVDNLFEKGGDFKFGKHIVGKGIEFSVCVFFFFFFFFAPPPSKSLRDRP